jgi:F-type H+-transporting ATPase subunit gamma
VTSRIWKNSLAPVKVMLDAYNEGHLDAVYICYTKFINTMKQEVVIEQLLPLSNDKMREEPRRPAVMRGTICTNPMHLQ